MGGQGRCERSRSEIFCENSTKKIGGGAGRGGGGSGGGGGKGSGRGGGGGYRLNLSIRVFEAFPEHFHY